MRTLFGPVIVLGFLGSACFADGPEKSQPAKLPPAPPDEPPVMRLVVSPAAEPVPALKYRLLPTLAEQTPGNGAFEYIQAINRELPRVDQNKVNPWLDLPPDRLPVKELETTLAAFKRTLRELEQASRREVCDWQLPIKRDGFKTRLDDFQNLRLPARVLSLQARLQIARGDLDGALSSMATLFKLSRDCNQGRLLITSLIGCAIASMNGDTLQAFVQHPQAPNLYWALTDLPSPLIDCREALNVEAQSLDYEYPQLAVFRSRRLSAEEARHQSDELLARWFHDLQDFGQGGPKTLEEARAKFASAARATNDKRALLDAGWSKGDVAAMAPEQIAWLISDRHWTISRDELFKWGGVPSPQAAAGAGRSEERFKESLLADSGPLAEFEFVRFMPSVAPLLRAVARRDRGIALLRVVKALRMYAATHEGKLPSALEAIEAVPIPIDVLSGQPFVYRLNADGTADLQTPAVHPNNRVDGKHFVIQVRK
jgi:hypothetical protein